MLVSVSEMLASIPTINPAQTKGGKIQFRVRKWMEEQEEEEKVTYEKRSTGFRDDVNLLATENVAENEGQDQHHDLKKDSDAGGLLLLAGSLVTIGRRNFILRAHSDHRERRLLQLRLKNSIDCCGVLQKIRGKVNVMRVSIVRFSVFPFDSVSFSPLLLDSLV